MKIEVMIEGSKIVLEYVGREGQAYLYRCGNAYFTFIQSLKVAIGKTVQYKGRDVYVLGIVKSESTGVIKKVKPEEEEFEE